MGVCYVSMNLTCNVYLFLFIEEKRRSPGGPETIRFIKPLLSGLGKKLANPPNLLRNLGNNFNPTCVSMKNFCIWDASLIRPVAVIERSSPCTSNIFIWIFCFLIRPLLWIESKLKAGNCFGTILPFSMLRDHMPSLLTISFPDHSAVSSPLRRPVTCIPNCCSRKG